MYINKFLLDGVYLEDNFHDYLKKELNLPDYYGNNLDALFDCLTEISGEIRIINSDNLDDKLLATFVDASCENTYLKLILE